MSSSLSTLSSHSVGLKMSFYVGISFFESKIKTVHVSKPFIFTLYLSHNMRDLILNRFVKDILQMSPFVSISEVLMNSFKHIDRLRCCSAGDPDFVDDHSRDLR